jgi:hypothetical protein
VSHRSTPWSTSDWRPRTSTGTASPTAVAPIHPAHGTERWQTIEPTGWRVRQSDHAFLTSPRAREILDHEGITVIDYRPLQRAWNA